MTTTLTTPGIESVTRPRSVERLIAGQPTSDGAGVKLTRVLTQPLQRRLDPFLMLDAFSSENPDDYVAGFRTIRTGAGNRHVHDRRPHAPSRQCGPRRPVSSNGGVQ
jgi:hypothetical protein